MVFTSYNIGGYDIGDENVNRVNMIQEDETCNRKRRKREDNDEEDDFTSNRIVGGKRRFYSSYQSSSTSWEEYCRLPITLKSILMNERKRVMNNNDELFNKEHCCQWKPSRVVHNLPASVPISTLLKHYVKIKKKNVANEDWKVQSFVDSIEKMFLESLSDCLLYPAERAQYASIQSNPTMRSLKLTDIYGCEFLLRLFIKLPQLISKMEKRSSTYPFLLNRDMGTNHQHEIGQHLVNLIALLQKNRQACFKANYRKPNFEELNDFEKASIMSGTRTATK